MKWVYLFNIEGTSIYKIGYTTREPDKRLNNVQVGCPFKLSIASTYDSKYGTKYGTKLEGILHRTYQLLRTTDEYVDSVLPGIKLRGEWFFLSKDIVDGFQNKCKEIEDRIDYIRANSTLDNF